MERMLADFRGEGDACRLSCCLEATARRDPQLLMRGGVEGAVVVVVVVVAILVVAVVGAADAVANLQERPKRGEWGTRLE